MKPNNPFIITGYHSPTYFCDRINETKKITEALYNGRNITLIAPRRIGKTGLIKNVFHALKKQESDIVTIYMDIYSTRSLDDLIQLMAASILGKLDSTTQDIMSRVSKFIKSCRPLFSFDEYSGKPTVTLDIAKGNEEVTLKEIFEYIASSEKRCYIAIDEFQQIATYQKQGVEALLRSYIQFIPNVNFIFSGSTQHVMQEMFLSAKRPFYQSTQTISVGIIDQDIYYTFANDFFEDKGFTLSKECFDYIYQKFDGHTWYVQSVLNRLYSYNKSVKSNKLIDEAIGEIIEESSFSYAQLLSAYTDNNVALIKAIAKSGKVSEINSSEFIAKYKLKAASSVNTSLAKLLSDELIYKSDAGYIVYDRFMMIWLREQVF